MSGTALPYRADIDGLRAIAVLLVVFFHAFPEWVKGGFIGVDVFFVISGYLISSIIFNQLSNNNFNLLDFYCKRVSRIFPALILVLAFCYLLGWLALLSDEYLQLGKHMAGASVFLSNFVLVKESGYFDNSAYTKPLLHLWSLGIEEQFYIIWPLIISLLWKQQRVLLKSIAILAIISFAFSKVTLQSDSASAFYYPHTRFWELLAGTVLAYFNYINKNITPSENRQEKTHLQKIINFLSLRFLSPNSQCAIGIALGLLGILFITKNKAFPGWWALLPVFSTVLIISAGPKSWFNRVILSNNILVWFGLISYPLYLWHWPLLSFARIIESETPSLLFRTGLVLLSIFLSWLTYSFIETPMRKVQTMHIKIPLLVICLAATGATGYSAYANDGLPNRAHIKNLRNNKNELIRTPTADDACKAQVSSYGHAFHYCRFNDMGAAETVAVIGDSHAHVAYPGIAELLATRNINTLLLANSSCPPFLGGEHGDTAIIKNQCKTNIEKLISIVVKKPEIKTVLIFSRGPIYMTGKGFGEAEKDVNIQPPPIPDSLFYSSLQNTINNLHESGKTVIYISENPEIGKDPAICIDRPLRLKIKDCAIDFSEVKRRQENYMNILKRLSNVTVVDVTAKFCDRDKCYAIRNGNLLYADDDHLSVEGSRFQAKQLLKKHLFK